MSYMLSIYNDRPMQTGSPVSRCSMRILPKAAEISLLSPTVRFLQYVFADHGFDRLPQWFLC